DAPEADALAPLRAKIAALPAAEQKSCVIQAYGHDGQPADAVVIGPTPQAKAKAPKNQPNTFCGAYGLNEDESSYWVVGGQKAMFLRMGQELQDIAAGTVTVMKKDAEGNWAAAVPARGALADCLLTVGKKTVIDGVCELNTSEDGGLQIF